MGDGGLIKNLGQKQFNLSDSSIGSDVQSVFQMAAVIGSLMSVGRICDEGHEITFNNTCAVVRTKQGEELCKFIKMPITYLAGRHWMIIVAVYCLCEYLSRPATQLL